jgi:hypothetical protein
MFRRCSNLRLSAVGEKRGVHPVTAARVNFRHSGDKPMPIPPNTPPESPPPAPEPEQAPGGPAEDPTPGLPPEIPTPTPSNEPPGPIVA